MRRGGDMALSFNEVEHLKKERSRIAKDIRKTERMLQTKLLAKAEMMERKAALGGIDHVILKMKETIKQAEVEIAVIDLKLVRSWR